MTNMIEHMSTPTRDRHENDWPLLLFVCSGNICRSPMGAVLAADAAARDGFDIRVASLGTMALVGERAEADAHRAVAEIGLSLAAHRARQANRKAVLEATLTVAATRMHRAWLRAQAPDANIVSFDELTGLGDIPDPYGASLSEYRVIREMLRAGMPKVLAALKASARARAKHGKSAYV
jgi:protein-tyrosine phosphatase